MAKLIKNGTICDDTWCVLAKDTELNLAPDLAYSLADNSGLLLPWSRWASEAAQLKAQGYPLGLWLSPDDEPSALLTELARLDDLPLIAIHFPHFTDGRGYTQAKLLRQRYAYHGELRAIGDILRDQLYFLQQCGFDAFSLRADQSHEAALSALNDYSWTPLTLTN